MTTSSLSATLVKLGNSLTKDLVSIEDIMKELPRGSFEMLILVFALLLALPVPYPPGLSTILVSPIVVLSLQYTIGQKRPWLPRQIRKKTFSRAMLEKIINKMVPWVRRVEYIMRPRLQFITHDSALRVNGLCILIMALCIAVPFPFTNKVPAICISFVCAGIILHDGLVAVLANIAGLTWVLLLLFLGVEGVTFLLELMK